MLVKLWDFHQEDLKSPTAELTGPRVRLSYATPEVFLTGLAQG